jgi:steroid 5-alpha reductase family enzyme
VFALDVSGGFPWGWAALSGPAYMYWLLTRVSGVPLLEAHMKRSRPAAFVAYARRTSVFFPRPPRR